MIKKVKVGENVMAKTDNEAKNFQQLREEWMGAGKSDNINYCMPVNIGVLAQNVVTFDESRLTAAVEEIMKQLGRWFGRFTSGSKTSSHNQLIVMTPGGNRVAGYITTLLQERYGAKLVYSSEKEMKEYCWVTITAWDGITDTESAVYTAIRNILSTADTPSQDYRLRFPENRPIFQIVLPDDSQGTLPSINYEVREIYPHMFETINDNEPWFSRSRYIDQNWWKKHKDDKRRNIKASALKIKKFNRQIIAFSQKVDQQTDNIYDLLPWHHQDHKWLPDYVNIANLREIYYDLISMKAQKTQNLQNRILMTLAVIAFGFFSAYSDLTDDYWLLVAYLVFIVAAYLFYWIFVKSVNAHNDYLEFRSLAEGMRVQCYWYAANINECVGSNYTVKFQKDMFWAAQAFRAWYVTDYLMKNNTDGSSYLEAQPMPSYHPENDYIKTEWLGTLLKKDESGKYVTDLPAGCPSNPPEQLGFFTSRISRFSVKNRHSKQITLGFTVFAIILSVVLAFCIRHFDFGHENWFVFAIGIINILTIIVTTNNQLNAYQELASKYSYCQFLAQKAVQDYDVDNSKATEIFKQFGIEALEENAEWLMIKNDREPAVPSN